jgi:hypothetical protein
MLNREIVGETHASPDWVKFQTFNADRRCAGMKSWGRSLKSTMKRMN